MEGFRIPNSVNYVFRYKHLQLLLQPRGSCWYCHWNIQGKPQTRNQGILPPCITWISTGEHLFFHLLCPKQVFYTSLTRFALPTHFYSYSYFFYHVSETLTLVLLIVSFCHGFHFLGLNLLFWLKSWETYVAFLQNPISDTSSLQHSSILDSSWAETCITVFILVQLTFQIWYV